MAEPGGDVIDVAIIGAGPAGCVAGILLARRGWSVSIIEQHHPGRDKVCGECISALGLETLDRLHLLEALAALGPARLRRARLVAPAGAEAAFDLPKEIWGLSRAAMDAALLTLALDAGAAIIQPARCEQINHGPLSVTVRHLPTNALETICISCVLVADGKGAAGAVAPPPTADLGVKAHFRGVSEAPDTISLFGLKGHYVGLAPVEGGRWNLAMSVPAERVKAFVGEFDALLEQMSAENPGLAARLAGATRQTPWLASPLPRFAVRFSGSKRVIPIGNAAAALEPIGGEGMGLAIRSAELAADAVHLALRENREIDAGALSREYQRLWRTRRAAARAAGLLMSSPRSAELLVSALNSMSWLIRPALVPLGKASGVNA
jgi:2-polyprenyl-6-methoxyphenol hydroxylase-like FAD-dependent oxidoreductase